MYNAGLCVTCGIEVWCVLMVLQLWILAFHYIAMPWWIMDYSWACKLLLTFLMWLAHSLPDRALPKGLLTSSLLGLCVNPVLMYSLALREA